MVCLCEPWLERCNIGLQDLLAGKGSMWVRASLVCACVFSLVWLQKAALIFAVLPNGKGARIHWSHP